jgi:MATE family multidrug resistance protein
MAGTRFRRDIVPIAFPIFLGMLVFQVQTLTNRAFLGRLDINYLTMISNVVFPMWTTLAMLNALTTGATILMSQALGAGDSARARLLAAAALKWNSIVALALFLFWFTCSGFVFNLMGVTGEVFGYCVRYTRISAFSFLFAGLSGALTSLFQASRKTRPLMYAGAIRSGLNIVFDWLLIFGSLGFPKLGYLGAAVASVLADLVGAGALGVLFIRGAGIEAKPDIRAVLAAPLAPYREIIRMGAPTSLEELMWNAGNLMLIRFLNLLDPLATAVYSLVFTIEILPIVVFMSLGQTTTVLVGRAKGAGELRSARGAAMKAQAAAWTACAAIAVLFAAAPAALVGVFTRDAAVISRAAPILLVSCFTLFPRSANFMAGSGIRGLGNTRWMLGTQIFGTVFVVLAGWFLIFPAGLGVMGLFIAMLADEGIRSLANITRFFAGSRTAASGWGRADADPSAAA